jgi:hypothetical protein
MRRTFLKLVPILALLLLTTFSSLAQETDGFKPSETNVWGAEYPRVDSAGKVQIRVKAPNATAVKVTFGVARNSTWPSSQMDFGW